MDEGATITGERPLSKTMKTMTCRAMDSGSGRRGRQASPTVLWSNMAAGNIFVLDVPAGKGSQGSPEKPRHSFGQLKVCSQASFSSTARIRRLIRLGRVTRYPDEKSRRVGTPAAP